MNRVGSTSGVRQVQPTSLLPLARSSSNFTVQTAAITSAMERRTVILSGSKMRLEWALKKSGVTMTAANQPTSMTRSQNALSLVEFIFASPWLRVVNRQARDKK